MYERQMHPDKNHINYVCACKVKVYAANVQSVSRTHLSNLINKTAKTEKITNAEIHHITKSDIKMKQFSDTHLKYHHLGHNHRTYDI